MSTYQGKVVWVTGASSGIGYELARQLATIGAEVIVSARREEKLKALQQSVHQAHRIHIVPLDLADSQSLDQAVAKVKGKFGKLDILINNAGLSQRSTAEETGEATRRKLMEINFFGPVRLTQAALPLLRESRHPQIAVVSSLAGKFGFYQRSAYSASKSALHGYFETLRLELESEGFAITMICPGGIKTDISKNALKGDGEAYGKMSTLQAEGMAADVCANHIIKAIAAKKMEVVIGQGTERISVKLKTIWPWLFWRLIRKNKPKEIS